ncbi:MAG: hypothetical protein K2Y28_08355 [Burkholderiaceae bacterium]|nr:hypothetical protein [Burkholderiaceae bacterium]
MRCSTRIAKSHSVGDMFGILICMEGATTINPAGTLEVVIGAGAVTIACAFSSFVGIFFGFYPARRASKLLPVDCLRYE